MLVQTPTRFPPNLALIVVSVLGLLLALVLGSLIGNNDSTKLFLIAGAAFGIFFVVQLHRYVWQMALFLIFCSFGFRPAGF